MSESAASTGREPLFEPAGLWSWNARGEEGNDRVEINLHDLQKTVVVSAKDVRQMYQSIDLERRLRRGR